MTIESSSRYTITLDDDPLVQKMIARATGLPSLPFTSCSTLVKRADCYNPVAVFVDVNLEDDECGLDIIPQLREHWPFTPIIVVTADSNDRRIGQALAIGANDFMRKPILTCELVARLQARLSESAVQKNMNMTAIDSIQFCHATSALKNDEHICYLPRLEANLFKIFLDNRGMLVGREELKLRLWGNITVSENTLDKKISRLRKALEEVDAKVSLESHYGKGFLLKPALKK